MSVEPTQITEALRAYVRDVLLQEPPVLSRLQQENAASSDWDIQVPAEQGQFLHFLARIIGARKIIELGVFTGYSSTWMALALPPDGKLVACDLNEEHTRRARRVWREAGVEDRVELRLGAALNILDELIAEGRANTFDLVFIDADKANYCHYYERALALLRPGGLIAADNTLWQGKVVDERSQDVDTRAIRAFNRMLSIDERIWKAFLTMNDGLTLACKK